MYKLLLSATATVLLGSTALAETVTFDFVNNDYGLTREYNTNAKYIDNGTNVTSDDVSITLLKADDNANGWRLWKKDGLRIFKNSGTKIKVTVADAVVTGIAFTLDSGVITGYSVNGGAEVEVSGGEFSWADDTGLENPEMSLTCTNKNGDIQTITVTYQPAAPDPLPAGLSFPQTSYSVNLGDTFDQPELSHDTDAAITYTSSATDVATVNANTGAVEILAAGTTTITATAEANATYNGGSASYTLTVNPVFTSIADAYSNLDGTQAIVNFPLTVTCQNGTSTYVTDGTNYSLIYGTAPAYQVGDIIPAGWKAELDNYQGLPELKIIETPAAATGTATFTPRQMTAIDGTMLNEVCILKDVEFADTTPSGETEADFDGIVGDTTYTFRNKFADTASVEPGTYDVLLAVATYFGALQLYPLSYTASEPSGIGAIEAADGEARYFNIQGVRVENPGNGLYIRVIDGKAQKIAIK